MLKALIFDVDGTLADTEMAHMAAFNHAFAELGLDWHWDVPLYTQLLEISGGKERIRHYWKQVKPEMRTISGMALEETIEQIHMVKTAAYEQAVLTGKVQMRPGVLELMKAAHQEGLLLAIATTTSSLNVTTLLRSALGMDWRSYFLVIEDASTAPIKKPHPQVYLQTLKKLGLSASSCLAFEDSSNGLRAARSAELATIVTPNSFTEHHDFSGALRIVDDLSTVTVATLRQWHQGGTA